jgi:hypothetical protein
VDWEEVRRFVRQIHREGGARLVLTVFPPSDDQPNIHLLGGLGDAHRREVERTLRKHPQHSLGLIPNPALPQPAGWGEKPEEKRKDGSPRVWGASNDHISGARAIWAECDGGLPLDAQEKLPELAGLPRPTMKVWSGNKSLHLYWLVGGEELLDPDQFRSLQRRLAAAIKAVAPEAKPDEGIHNPARVMRLAGGLHPKTGNRCSLLPHEDGRTYSAEELERLIPPLPSSSSSSSSSKSSSGSSPSMGSGSGWFDRLTPERQEETAVEMLRRVPLRTKAGEGLYGDSFKILAGLVHHFGEATAVDLCERAGWRSDAWDPSSKAKTIRPIDRAADVGNLIGAARDNGWQHPLALEEKRLADGFGIESPRPVVVTEEGAGGPAAPPPPRPAPAPRSFDDRWKALEAAADELVGSSKTAVRLAAEMAAASSELDLRLSRRDLEHLLEAAARRLRPTAAPIEPGGRYKVNPTLWALEGIVRHGLNLLVGGGGVGKSRFALALAAAWLRGDPYWLGLELHGPASTEERELLILGTDQNRDDWDAAMLPLGLAKEVGEGERDLHPRIKLITMECGTVLDADGLALVRRWCDEHPGGMVLADSLAELLPPGVDEDRAGAARPVHALAEALGGCWGLLLHHTRKAAGKDRILGVGAGRGSGAIDAAVSRVIGLGLIHKMEDGTLVPQEADPRRELLSTKRGGATQHLIVRSDGSGAWTNEGSAAALKTEERRQKSIQNLTTNQQEALAALESAPGQLLTTRQAWEATGGNWEEDRSAGGAGSALLRKTMKRLEVLGLVESVLAGNERTYRAVGSSGSSSSGIEAEGDQYESPERLADIREERIPQAVREERDTNRVWEAQHSQRTEREEELLEAQQQTEEAPLEPVLTLVAEKAPLPMVGELVEIADGRGGWQGGYTVDGVSSSSITLRSLATGKTLTKRPSAKRSPWRRPEDGQQQLLLAG